MVPLARRVCTIGMCSLHHARGKGPIQASLEGVREGKEKDGLVLQEQRRDGARMIFWARATRGLRRPSLGQLAHLGLPVGEWVRTAVGKQSDRPPKREKDRVGRIRVAWLAGKAETQHPTFLT